MKRLAAIFLILISMLTNSFAIAEEDFSVAKLPSRKANLNATKNAEKSDSENVKIKEIQIEGANFIRPEEILNRLQLQRGDEYSRDILQTDLKSIYKTGFFTEKMKAVPVMNNDGSVTIKIILEENTPVTDFLIDGNTVISTDEILTFLDPLKGKPQNIDEINSALTEIQNYYASKGYILARIDTLYDDPDGTINLHINEGVIDRIMISGNEKTKDYIIARNILTEAGTVYNENQIGQDLVRLYATQAFKDVKRDIEPSERDPEKYDVTIQVEEQRSAAFSIGAGVDSATGLFGSVGLSDNNFRGLNQRVSLNLLGGSGIILNDSAIINRGNFQAELSFFEPYFINADNSFLSKLFFRDFGSYQIPLAIERRFGAEATVSHKIKSNSHLSSSLSLGVENVHLDEGDEDGIRALYNRYFIPISERANQLKGGTFLSLSPGLLFDSRDSAVNPRNGVIASLRFDEALNIEDFDTSYGKLTGSIKKFVPVGKKSSLSFTARAGGKTWGEMPEVMGYRLGGPYSIRGFKMSGVGTGDAFIMGSAELATPIPFMDKLKLKFMDNVRLTFFVDAGKIFNPTITDVIYERPMQAITAGVGLKLYIPGIGPLSVDYGVPITNPGDNSRGYFTFGIGDMMY